MSKILLLNFNVLKNFFMYFEYYAVDWCHAWNVRMMIYGVVFVT